MRRCLKGKIIALSMVGLGSFLMGASLGLALGIGEDDDEELYESSPEDDSFKEVVTDYKEMSENLYSSFTDEYSYVDDMEFEEDTEIINSTPYLNEDDVLVKETSEGLLEIVEPYIISEDEFMDPNVFTEFERNTLIYYEADDTLTTDRDEVVTNVEELIGSSALTSFGYKTSNPDSVFVRNIKLGSNFEILREEGSYQVTILGLPEEDVDYEKAKKFFKNLDDDGR